MIKILFLGDIFGKTGRDAVIENLSELKKEYEIDYVIANAENASHGKGLSSGNADELLDAGVDFITLGNHAWSNPDIKRCIDDYPVIRPANFSGNLPGRGFDIREIGNIKVGVINLQGRVYMDDVCDSPFDKAVEIVNEIHKETPIVIIDMHAEATSEKMALAAYLDGKISALLGTHTHVQTADERIMPKGTAYISDVGMCGPESGIIGASAPIIIKKFTTGMPQRFEPATADPMINAVVLTINPDDGKTQKIERIYKRL